MQVSKVNDWLQIIASIGVLVGVLLVAHELKQNNELAKSETIRGLYQMWTDIYQFEFENDIELLIRKSVEEPENLSDAEYYHLDDYYSLLMNAMLAQASMDRYQLALGTVIDEAPFLADEYFGNRFARAWFFENKGWAELLEPEFAEALAREIENSPAQTKDDYLDRIKSRMQ